VKPPFCGDFSAAGQTWLLRGIKCPED